MALRTGVQFSPYQQSFKVNIGTQSVNVNFQGANTQFAWVEISPVFDQHQTVYDSYDAELAATKIQSLKLENASTTYSLMGGLLYDTHNEDNKHWLYSCLLRSSVKAARLHHYLNMEITKFFKNYLKNEITLPTQTKNCTLT